MVTKEMIEQMATDIKNFLDRNHLSSDVCIYFNNKRWSSFTENIDDSFNTTFGWKEEKNINPHDYMEYCAYDHILSMSFEGTFYYVMNNYSGAKFLREFDNILEKYGVYYELGEAWNLSVYPSGYDISDFEYTKYKKPKEKIRLYYRNRSEYDEKLSSIMEEWHDLSEQTGDIGSCVIGAGFEFELDGENYWMSECSPWQGSVSWETHVPHIQSLLENIGATNVNFHYGMLD